MAQIKASDLIKLVLKRCTVPEATELTTVNEHNKLSLVSTIVAANRLSSNDCLGNIIQYNDTTEQWFIYELNGPGVWWVSSELMVDMVIMEILRQASVYHHVKSPSYIHNIRISLQAAVTVRGFPENPRDLFVFTNGVLDSNLKGPLRPHSPFPYCFNLFPYDYNPEAKCPQFLEFLHTFCSGYQDRMELIRAFMRSCISSMTYVQKFLEVVGEGHTGKSVFQTVLIALVGFENSVITTLRDLNSNTFEVTNLQHKRLIVISDTEMYSGPVGVLKQITGNDYVVGRQKHQQGAINVYIEGMVIVIGNYPMYPRDATTGFLRRLIQFPATNVVKGGMERSLIISSPSGQFSGPLAEELSGIFNWVFSGTQESTVDYLRNPTFFVPSLRDSVFRGSIGSNSISSWVEDELTPGPGMYVGGAVKDPSNKEMAYPTYLSYCERNGLKPLSLKVFSTNLISVIRSTFEGKGFVDVSLKRKEVGSFVTGISRSPRLSDANYLRGGDLSSGMGGFPESSFVVPGMITSSVPTTLREEPTLLTSNGRLRHSLRDIYKEFLEKPSPRKTFLRKTAKEVDVGVNIEEYTPITASSLYVEGVQKVLDRGFKIYKARGPVVDTYTNSGISPRITPYQYGSSYNSIKRSLRNKLVGWSGNLLFQELGYRMIDVDLVSCYTSILLGLYNKRLPKVELAVRRGLWKTLEEEFHKHGYGEVFHKPSVKIAVHASLFRGGSNAMIKGIMDKWRKDAGLATSEWKELPESKQVLERAQSIVGVLARTDVIKEQRELSSFLEFEWKDKTLKCPTGHEYRVGKDSFGSCYAHYLQSYEIGLVAETVLGVRDAIPEIEIIGHFHDGVTLIYPQDKHSKVVELLTTNLNRASQQLGLVYPNRWEVQFEIP